MKYVTNKIAHTYADIHLISSPQTIVLIKGDSAASNHYWRKEDAHIFTPKGDIESPTVQLPNNGSLTSNQQGAVLLLSDFTQKEKTH